MIGRYKIAKTKIVLLCIEENIGLIPYQWKIIHSVESDDPQEIQDMENEILELIDNNDWYYNQIKNLME